MRRIKETSVLTCFFLSALLSFLSSCPFSALITRSSSSSWSSGFLKVSSGVLKNIYTFLAGKFKLLRRTYPSAVNDAMSSCAAVAESAVLSAASPSLSSEEASEGEEGGL